MFEGLAIAIAWLTTTALVTIGSFGAGFVFHTISHSRQCNNAFMGVETTLLQKPEKSQHVALQTSVRYATFRSLDFFATEPAFSYQREGGWSMASQKIASGGAGTPVPPSRGGGPHDKPEPPCEPGVQREVPIGTPGTLDELRRRKRKAEEPAPGSQSSPPTPAQEDHSKD